MMKNLSIILICLFASCVSEQKQDTAMSVLSPCDSLNVEVGAPTLIQKAGNLLYINHSISEQHFMDAIDIKGDSILYSFAPKGQGPNEFLQIASMDLYQHGDEWFLMLFDNMKRECTTYSIDSLNRYKGNCPPANKLNLPPSSRYLELYRMKHFYIASGRTAKKFTLLGKDSLEYIKSCGEYLNGNETDTDSMTISKANYGRQYVSPHRDKLLGTVFMSGTLSLYTINSDTIRKVWDYTASNFEYEKRANAIYQKSPVGYLAAGFMGEAVIGLYSGEEKGMNANYGKEFHVLDETGNLQKKYSIASNGYNFCVDARDSLIYMISYNPDPKIVMYNLKNSKY